MSPGSAVRSSSTSTSSTCLKRWPRCRPRYPSLPITGIPSLKLAGPERPEGQIYADRREPAGLVLAAEIVGVARRLKVPAFSKVDHLVWRIRDSPGRREAAARREPLPG